MKKQLCLLCVALMGLTVSCKKDKVQDRQPEEIARTITSYIEQTNELSEIVRTSGTWELGVLFSSSIKGKITKIGCRMPEIGKYMVTVWDADTKEKLTQSEISQTTGGSLVLQNITPLGITANKKYIISVNSKDLVSDSRKNYYVAKKTDSSPWMPVTVNGITLHCAQYSFSATPVFPDEWTLILHELYGFPEFTFITD